MKNLFCSFFFLFFLLCFISCSSLKFHPYLHQLFNEDNNDISLIQLEEYNNEININGEEFIWNLISHAQNTQQPIIELLKSLNILDFKCFWISNFIQVKTSFSNALKISEHSLVLRLEPNIKQKRVSFIKENSKENMKKEVLNIEWNLDWINIPDVWALNYTGNNIIIATADTGVQWNHPALINQYRGYDSLNSLADHNYNWWDAIHDSSSSSCGSNSIEPCDDVNHGTHTIGTAVGYDQGSNQIGVAFNAKWIGCRNMDEGDGTPSEYIECLQFFTAPTDLNGNNPDPSLRPHVIINSYGCPPSEGCTDLNILKSTVENVISSGIFMSVAAGNSGPSCSSISEPPAIYSSSFTVGASSFESNSIASFISRGPVNVPPEGLLIKPDITAPGASVRSSVPENSYATFSGTSMAAPHIAGVVALLYEANPDLQRDITNVINVLTSSTTQIVDSGCSSSNSIPNNFYGYGVIDALVAVLSIIPSTPSNIPISNTPTASISPIPTPNITPAASISNTPTSSNIPASSNNPTNSPTSSTDLPNSSSPSRSLEVSSSSQASSTNTPTRTIFSSESTLQSFTSIFSTITSFTSIFSTSSSFSSFSFSESSVSSSLGYIILPNVLLLFFLIGF